MFVMFSLLVLSLFCSLVEVHCQISMTISRSHNDTVYIGTQLTLTSHVSVSGVDDIISVEISWTRGNDGLVNDSHTTVSAVSGNSSRYSASLSFSPVTTADGGPIIVIVTITSPLQNVTISDTHILEVTVPRPIVAVSAAMRKLVSGSSLSLSCSIQPLSVDTSTTITSNWTTPGGRYDRVNGDSDTSPELVISSVETADSGVYTCSVIVTDSTDSQFILDSPINISTISITVKLKVTVSAIYTSAPGEAPGELGPNDFKAGNRLTLKCSVEGYSGGLSYNWSVTGNPSTPSCYGCNIDTSSTTSLLVLGRLHSFDAGNYTCDVSETGRPASSNSGNFSVTIFGAGMTALQISPGPIANNGLIMTNSTVYSRDKEMIIDFISNSSQSGVGNITTPNGTTLTPYATIGALYVVSPFDRPGVLRLRQTSYLPLPVTYQGIYTCTIPDSNGVDISLNVGVYLLGFNDPPTIISLTYEEENCTLICVSTGSPPTVVSWMKDGENITIDRHHFSLSQTITDRASSTYNNILTVGEGVTEGVAGVYNCTVSNVLGSDSTGIIAVGILLVGRLNGDTYYEVKEGESVSLSCTPIPETVALDWELPHPSTVVQYQEPLRHTLTIHGANINHNGNYTCSAVEDETSSITAYVRVLERCLEDLSGGLFWSTAFDGDTVSRPCRDVDKSFSPVVRVYRRCLSHRRWTSVDFSGCVLASSKQKVLVILSLRANFTGGITSNISLEEQLRETAQTSGGSAPLTSSVIILPQTLDQYSLVVWKVSYTTAELALAGKLDSVFCSYHNFTTGVIIEMRPDIIAIMRSDFCECRQVQFAGNYEENQQCPTVNIQELCNGTIASPCDCQPFQECQCTSPYVGDGSLCVLDSDGDGYPDRALRTCSSDDQLMYCSADTCPFAQNLDQSDTSPCVGDETNCPEEVDQVWNILWPFTPPGVTVTISCGVNFVGNATRLCQSDMTWAEPNVINCQSRVFVDIMERADEALESEDTEAVLGVVGELAEATANEETPQLPQDLNTTIGIITGTLGLLFTDLNNETNMTAADTTVVFEVLDNILSESNQASYDSLQEVGVASQAVVMNAESFGLFTAQALPSNEDTGPGQVVNITGENMVLRVQSVDDKAQYSFPSPQEIKNFALPNSTLANISLSSSFLAEGTAGQQSMSVVVASILFTTLQMFLPLSSSERVGGEPASLIISSQIAVDEGRATTYSQSEEGVVIEFQFPSVPIRDHVEKRVARCAFWDFGSGSDSLADSGWSVENVTTEKVTVSGGQSTVRCSSSHLTSFAVLVDVRGVKINSRALSIVSYIGLTISIICLIFTIIFFISLKKKLFTAVHKFIHLNLAISLLAGYLVFAVGVELASTNKIGCKAVTALIQYFFLAAFSWMLCEGVMLYLMLVKVFSTLKNKWWLFPVFGWGIPLPLVAIGLGALHEEYGVKDDITGKFQYCWLSSGDGTYAMWTFVAPMLAIILVNVVFLILVLRVIYKTKKQQEYKKKSMKGKEMGSNVDVVKSTLKATVILLPLLGMTWVFGLLAVNENTAVFAWIFTILNSLQGFFIFFFHVLRDRTISTRIRALCSSTIYNKFGILLSTLRSRTYLTSSRLSALKLNESKTSSFVSETESAFNGESIIVQSPKFPVTFEGKEISSGSTI